MTVNIITIDGPSGSGKGTLAKKIAQHYDYHILDSGALYRLLGLSLANHGYIDALEKCLDQAIQIAKNLDIQFVPNAKGINIFLDQENVTNLVRTEKIGEYASHVATFVPLREALLERQQNFAKVPGLVADGRDMGTVIFPHAIAKIYLTASAESRAKRRFKQLQDIGQTVNMENILANIEARDKRDTERTASPLVPANDAYTIDSSELSIEQVFQKMVQFIDSKIKALP